ncbi:hypothetical protein [Microbaculum marinum]|uniref:Thioesterase domain-containing protein n=1 Tax=Microbaculum marinum TaxID=1764581 RepID=A0AAW9RQU6_9HYPH
MPTTRRSSNPVVRASGLCMPVLALIAGALLLPSSAAAGCSDVTPTRPGEVYLFRGLGNIYSAGPDEMAAQFSKLGMKNCVDNHLNWMQFADDILERSDQSDISYPIILIGHSLGARAAVSMANHLGKNGVPVAYVAMFDPVESTRVGGNVGEVVNYYVKIPLTNKLARSGEGFTGTIENVGLSGWSGVSHFNIDNLKRLQFSIYLRALYLSDSALLALSEEQDTESDVASSEPPEAPGPDE